MASSSTDFQRRFFVTTQIIMTCQPRSRQCRQPNSPLADRSPYHGIAEVRSGVFELLTAGFDKLVFDADEIFECKGGERVVALGYYYFRFHGQAEERNAQVAHVWTIRDGRAVKFQQYLDTLQVARDAGAV
jgi:ketosteroid isomerase-like protein